MKTEEGRFYTKNPYYTGPCVRTIRRRADDIVLELQTITTPVLLC